MIELRLLKAEQTGWQLMEQSEENLSYNVETPGVHRAEVRITPRHLAPYLASYADLAEQTFVWIYANPIYVMPYSSTGPRQGRTIEGPPRVLGWGAAGEVVVAQRAISLTAAAC